MQLALGESSSLRLKLGLTGLTFTWSTPKLLRNPTCLKQAVALAVPANNSIITALDMSSPDICAILGMHDYLVKNSLIDDRVRILHGVPGNYAYSTKATHACTRPRAGLHHSNLN